MDGWRTQRLIASTIDWCLNNPGKSAAILVVNQAQADKVESGIAAALATLGIARETVDIRVMVDVPKPPPRIVPDDWQIIFDEFAEVPHAP